MCLKEIKLKRVAGILLVGGILGFVLLMAVFCLPLSEVIDAKETAEIFRSEGNRPAVIPSYIGSTGDNYTDALMIAEAIYDDPDVSPLEKAVYVYRRGSSDSATADLADQLEGKEMQWVMSYTRYWHGYLVLLRPLLMLMSYADLRMLMCMVQMLLFGLTLVVMTRRGRMEWIIPFFAVIMTLSPMGSMISLQYFASYGVMMLGILMVLCQDEWLSQGARYVYFFLLLGMLTCYLDFLTYPLATLCMPLLLVLAQHADDKRMFRFAAACGAAWCVGYLGFWGMKWVMGSLLVRENLILNAYYHAKFQMASDHAATGSRWEAITENLSVICRPGYAVLYSCSALACAFPLLRRRGSLRTLFSGSRPLMLLVALVPFAWWLLAANHSLAHWLFTYRLLIVTVFAVLIWLTSGWNPCKQNEKGCEKS